MKYLDTITHREYEVLCLLIEGFTDNEVATILFISEKTAETHRSNLLKKTGAKNAVHLCAIAFRKDWVK